MNRMFWKRLVGSLLIAFVSLSLTRLVFYVNLAGYFQADTTELLSAFSLGLRFDAVTVAYLLGPFFIALPFVRGGIPEKLTIWFFIGMLSVMNLLNCIDAEFFRFTSRRSTDDLFEFAFLSDDLFNIGPNLIIHFWYLLAAFLLIMLGSYWSMRKLFRSSQGESISWRTPIELLVVSTLLILGARGGFQRIPISIIDASKIDRAELNPVVLSTPFTIIKTLGKPELPEFNFDTREMADLTPIAVPGNNEFSGRFRGKNVVVIIVESLSTEYIGALNGLEVGYTPFIDSLCTVSMVFDNAFANGHRSIEGIPAVLASVPTLMYEPFTTSRYAGNRISSLTNLLASEGYFSAFMHGGNKNSMNFESFAKQAGFDIIYDRDDYPHPDAHYDGYWGISDHYFLQQCVSEFSQFEQPFVASVFTLSSHHPYAIPEEFKGRFPKGTLPIHESIGYADEALRVFFQKASNSNWFNNTLFVITADHTSLSENEQYQTKLGSLRIPILLYQPGDSSFIGKPSQLMQQIDIMPTVLNLVGLDNPFFSFGTDAFEPTAPRMAVAFKYDQYQMLRHDQLLCFDGSEATFVYDLSIDALLKNNLLHSQDVSFNENEAYLKAFLKNYSTALINNRMTVEAWNANHP
ncbi:MAG: LTA synthase family protein [Bacteroidetes bacterium]|nr:MAG: LTA synthase family protein [Bacteroidota bacterium]